MNPGILTLERESIIYLRGESGLFGEIVTAAGEMPFSFAVVLYVTAFMQWPSIFSVNENCGDSRFS